jgi:B-box zinc finger protein/cell wall-active antibiotic response 4TMS protein YvqF
MNCAIHNDTPATAYCRTCGKAMCAQCTREVKGVIYCEDCIANSLRQASPAAVPPPPPPSYGPQPTYAQPVRGDGPNPVLAGLLSILPGLGAVYCGEVMRGVMQIAVYAGLIYALINFGGGLEPVFGLAIAFWYIYQIIDSVRLARAKQRGLPAPDPFGLSDPGWASSFRSAGKGLPSGPVFLIVIGCLLLVGIRYSYHFFAHALPIILIYLGAMRIVQIRQRPGCRCMRCQTHCMMWPAILITLGILFLLDGFLSIDFNRTWPVLIIVIGGIKFLQVSGSTEGHVGPGEPGSRYTPPPAPVAEEQKESQVNHG